jgi:endonuclease/exonuclease/phosphatase family metal-dependent hydrolase
MGKTLRVVFANIYQGLIYEGKSEKKDVFSKYWPSLYQEQYAALEPDILCLAEVPLDDDHGNSVFLDSLGVAMGAASKYADVHDKSWLVEGKYYGNAIISKYRLTDYQIFKLPNPRLEVDRPDGQHWLLRDKSVQSAVVSIHGRPIRLFNLHYYPIHHFYRNISEPEFIPIRRAFIEQLHLDDTMPKLLTGDFNNNDEELELAFPELFADGALEIAVRFGREQLDSYYTGNHQMDHILYTPHDFTVVQSEIIRDASDHRGVLAVLELHT